MKTLFLTLVLIAIIATATPAQADGNDAHNAGRLSATGARAYPVLKTWTLHTHTDADPAPATTPDPAPAYDSNWQNMAPEACKMVFDDKGRTYLACQDVCGGRSEVGTICSYE